MNQEKAKEEARKSRSPSAKVEDAKKDDSSDSEKAKRQRTEGEEPKEPTEPRKEEEKPGNQAEKRMEELNEPAARRESSRWDTGGSANDSERSPLHRCRYLTVKVCSTRPRQPIWLRDFVQNHYRLNP